MTDNRLASLAAASTHLLHCAMAADQAVLRRENVDRLQSYFADVRKWAELCLEDAIEPETRTIAGRIAPRGVAAAAGRDAERQE